MSRTGLLNHPIGCPYCAAKFDILLDPSAPIQEYIEDCQVCCRPITVVTDINEEKVDVKVRTEDE